MRSLKASIIAVLSDPEVTENELRYTFSWLRNGGIDECERAAKKIRTIYMSLGNEDNNLLSSDHYLIATKTKTSKANKFINYWNQADNDRIHSEVARLLILEGGLTKGEAISRLNEKLNFVLPGNTRDSFNSAISKLSNLVGQSNVLSAAQIIRNQLVKNNKINAWPLKEDIDDSNN